MEQPEVAIVVTTYQRPAHLWRSLLSLALQRVAPEGMEVVVADDGSQDETPEVVERFAASVPFRVECTTHPHAQFHPARSRNEGASATTAPYLLYLDGDCLVPPDLVATHLRLRRAGRFLASEACRLDEATTQRIDEEAVRSAVYCGWASPGELRRLARRDRKARLYSWLGHPSKPRLIGSHFSLWRCDYERINGFDERFEGWGCEDDDFGLRLRRAGVQYVSVHRWTFPFHMWHPTDPSIAGVRRWRDTPNVRYLHRRGVLLCCRHGLAKRPWGDLTVRVVPDAERNIFRWIPAPEAAPVVEAPEVEVVAVPGPGQFSGQAQCRVLVVLADCPQAASLARRADVVVGNQAYACAQGATRYPLSELPRALSDAA